MLTACRMAQPLNSDDPLIIKYKARVEPTQHHEPGLEWVAYHYTHWRDCKLDCPLRWRSRNFDWWRNTEYAK